MLNPKRKRILVNPTPATTQNVDTTEFQKLNWDSLVPTCRRSNSILLLQAGSTVDPFRCRHSLYTDKNGIVGLVSTGVFRSLWTVSRRVWTRTSCRGPLFWGTILTPLLHFLIKDESFLRQKVYPPRLTDEDGFDNLGPLVTTITSNRPVCRRKTQRHFAFQLDEKGFLPSALHTCHRHGDYTPLHGTTRFLSLMTSFIVY